VSTASKTSIPSVKFVSGTPVIVNVYFPLVPGATTGSLFIDLTI